MEAGAAKTIAGAFEPVIGRKPDPNEAEAVMNEMKCIWSAVAEKLWHQLLKETPGLSKWRGMVKELYLTQKPSMIDIEMACCEVIKYETAVAYAAGGRDRRPKSYFEEDGKRRVLNKVPLCRRKDGEGGGGDELETVLVDFTPRAARANAASS